MLPTNCVAHCIILLSLAACSVTPRDARWPTPETAENEPENARIAAQPVCVGALSWSAGALGDTVLYRSEQVGRKLEVGYFVYWSEERPWGENFFSYTALPALAMDAVYSHFLYVFPGLKDTIYGPGDVEGALVEYEVRDDGTLAVVRGVADDASHGQVQLSRADLLDSKGRVVLLTDVWSHQLGSHGGGQFGDTRDKDLKCYRGAALQPMTEKIARVFRLGNERDPRRGNPAWIDPVVPRGGVPEQQLATGKPHAVRQ
ncbi:MAG TPA: hypothetical protein VGM44_14100 [Polyangiaceae bacterium]